MSKATPIGQVLRARFPDVCAFFNFAGWCRCSGGAPLRKAVRAVPLPIEGLEPRRLLSCTNNANVLTCDGTTLADTTFYAYQRNGEGIYVKLGSNVDGPYSTLTKVILNGLTGNDVISVGTNSNQID